MPSLRTVLTSGLSVVVIALGLLVWRQHQAIAALQAHAAAATPGVLTVNVVPSSSVRTTGTGATVAPTASVGRENRLRDERRLEGLAELMENPKFLRAMVSHQRTMLDGRFGELFRRLDLNDEELESLRALLIEKQNAALDVLMVSRGEVGGTLTGGEIKQAATRARSDIDEMIRQTLGDERYGIYKAYEASMPQRSTVAQLQQRLSYTDSPLEPRQAEALVDLMVEVSGENTVSSRPGVSVIVDPSDQQAVPIVQGAAESSPVTPEMLELAGRVLDSRQLKAFTDLGQELYAAAMVVDLARETMATQGNHKIPSTLEGLDIHLLLQ
ncbi:hypothetical protein [Synoicihabitans lomoniglobus]|uniref:Uncharacterized protein n=1 Tax=Synoicihabitans lomoniglobus TaxID=2909285 RepID=A0AAE9ZYE1_9BACT|nr:hypothetical protein [Opitutaceae bacterium LMO-M01]WED65320.1 hypothetical protein PXH66_00470 [Opitutaceae bacterium LMO-M01]